MVQLTEALFEAEEVIEESTAARYHYLMFRKNMKKIRSSKEDLSDELLVRRRHTSAPQAPVPIHTLSHEGSPELRQVADKVLGNLQRLPDSWPVIRFDLMLHKSASYYAIWRRFCILMNIFGHSPRRPLMQLLMSMHEGFLSIWCSSWLSGSSWPWSLQGFHKGSCARLSIPS